MGVGFSPVSFFSYFTNLSNLIVSLIFIFAAVALWRREQPSFGDDLVRGAGVVYCLAILLAFFLLSWLWIFVRNRMKRNVTPDVVLK